jgi:hypothetical protein
LKSRISTIRKSSVLLKMDNNTQDFSIYMDVRR